MISVGNKILIPKKGINLKEDLISVWEFDETSGLVAYDAHGGNDSDIEGTVTLEASAPLGLGTSYDPDGTSGYVNHSANIADFINLTEGAISGWVYFDGSNGNNLCIMTDLSSTNYLLFFRILNSGKIQILIKDANDIIRAESTNAVNSSAWNHIVYTTDSSGHKVYLNGQEETMVYTTGNSSTQGFFDDVSAAADLLITGAIIWGSTNYFSTNPFDQLAIWNRALTIDEIPELYNSGDGLAYSEW